MKTTSEVRAAAMRLMFPKITLRRRLKMLADAITEQSTAPLRMLADAIDAAAQSRRERAQK